MSKEMEKETKTKKKERAPEPRFQDDEILFLRKKDPSFLQPRLERFESGEQAEAIMERMVEKGDQAGAESLLREMKIMRHENRLHPEWVERVKDRYKVGFIV